MFLTALLVRLGWRKREGSAQNARQRLQDVLLRDKAQPAPTPAPAPPPRKPTADELIESGTLRILPGEVKKPLPTPAPAIFNLPTAGKRVAGMVYNADRTLYAAVQLMPDDAFWVTESRFPEWEWRRVLMGGEVRRVQRVGLTLIVENPQEADGPGCWLPYRMARSE